MKKQKICVYSCITGDYDIVNEIKKETGIDYYLFTNNDKIKSNTWKVIYIQDSSLSDVVLARKIKILGHPLINENYDIALWMDGTVSFNTKIKDFIHQFMGPDDVFVAFKHGERSTIRDEANACVKFRKEDKNKIKKLLNFYKKENYLDNNGLIESTVYIKRVKDTKVMETMQLWFDMIQKFTKRDQLSFNYCISKKGMKVKWINEKVFDNPYFTWHSHKLSHSIKGYRVYFGDEEKNYDMDKDVQGDYTVDGDTYSFQVKVLADTNEVYIHVSDMGCIAFNHLQIANIKKSQYITNGYVNYNGQKIFYNRNVLIKITKAFSKGDLLQFSIDMKMLDDDEKLDFIKYLGDNINLLEEESHSLQQEINNMVNSRSWKLTKPLRAMCHLLKK